MREAEAMWEQAEIETNEFLRKHPDLSSFQQLRSNKER